MKKLILILAISASFIAGTMVAGNLVFAAPADSQNELLSGILEQVQALNSLITTPETENSMRAFVTGTLVCPNSDAFSASFFIQFDTGITGGTFSMSTLDPQFPVSLGGGVVTGQLDLTSFSLQAIIKDATCFPEGQGRAIVATASGNCGRDETVIFSTNTGMTGTFQGSVACI